MPEGAGRCPACLELVQPPGFLERLFRGLRVQVTASPPTTSNPGLHFNLKTTVKQTFKIYDAKTGDWKEYQSLDEVPSEYRARLRQALDDKPPKS